MLSVIGKGAYGKVLLVRKKEPSGQGELYAMKVLKKSEILRRNQVEHTMTERRILGTVRHPFIVKMDYAFQSETKLFFVLEYCPGGELFFYLSQIGRFKEDAADSMHQTFYLLLSISTHCIFSIEISSQRTC